MISFLRPVFFTASTTRVVLPGVDKGAVDRLLVREDLLQSFDQIAAARFQHRRQNGRHVEDLGRFGEPDHVVHDHGRLVAMQVGELERLMVDQDQDRVLRGEKGVESGFRRGCLGHVITPVWWWVAFWNADHGRAVARWPRWRGRGVSGS